MANKCTPKPASFDCVLITNNSRWESKICMYKKVCWSCLSRLPRSLLLKQICTFCSPGRDTSSGWTRILSASPSRERLEELQRGCRVRPCRQQSLSALAGVCIKPHQAGEGIESLLVFSPACPGQLHMSVPAAELTRVVKSH